MDDCKAPEDSYTLSLSEHMTLAIKPRSGRFTRCASTAPWTPWLDIHFRTQVDMWIHAQYTAALCLPISWVR